MFKKRTKLSGGVDSKRRKLVEPSQVKEANENDKRGNDHNDEQLDMTNKCKETDAIITSTSTITTTTTTYTDSEISKKKKDVVHEHLDLSEDEQQEETASQNEIQATIKTFLNKPKLTGSSKQIKQAPNLKNTVLMDYQPDICKDFKQTGYCGYGDNCKFLHSRDDFKTGWKLNKDWEAFQQHNQRDANLITTTTNTTGPGGDLQEVVEKTIEKTIRDVPFKCVMCRNDYKNPVVTSCGHYFCNKCFFRRIKDTGNKKCVICGHDTKGSAKVAANLQQILRLQQQQKEEKEEKRVE